MRINLLGGLTLERAGAPLRALPRKRMALLAFLAGHGRPVSRERLAAFFWPESTEPRARHALSQALYAIRTELGDVIVGTSDLRLDPLVTACDLWQFEQAVRAGDLVGAASVYHGPFLAGVHVPQAPELERWIEEKRDALMHEHARVLDGLAQAATAESRQADAVQWLRQRVLADPLDSRVARQLVEAMAAAGDRVGALQFAREHAEALQRELGIGVGSPLRESVGRIQAELPVPEPEWLAEYLQPDETPARYLAPGPVRVAPPRSVPEPERWHASPIYRIAAVLAALVFGTWLAMPHLLRGSHAVPALPQAVRDSVRPVDALHALMDGEAAMARGDYIAAVAAFSRAVRADSTYALAWYRLSIAADQANHVARGEPVHEQISVVP